MTRIHRAFAFSAVLFGAPLLAESALAAQSTQTAPASSPVRTGETTALQVFQRVEPNVPPTPMPLSLPDPARPAEIRSEYGFGLATLIGGAVFVSLVIYAVVYFAVRRTWSATH